MVTVNLASRIGRLAKRPVICYNARLMNLVNSLISSLMAIVLSTSLATPSASLNQESILASREFSLEKRYAVESVNDVMKKNILLNLAYLEGTVTSKQDLDWDKVNQPQEFNFTLKPGETFAYHDLVRSEFRNNLAVTARTGFNASDGYLSDGYLYGDGVCHFASLINWAAQNAGLMVVVPKDHRSVGQIPEVPADYGVSIYKNEAANIGAENNLYITNNQDKAVTFSIQYDGKILKVSVSV